MSAQSFNDISTSVKSHSSLQRKIMLQAYNYKYVMTHVKDLRLLTFYVSVTESRLILKRTLDRSCLSYPVYTDQQCSKYHPR